VTAEWERARVLTKKARGLSSAAPTQTGKFLGPEGAEERPTDLEEGLAAVTEQSIAAVVKQARQRVEILREDSLEACLIADEEHPEAVQRCRELSYQLQADTVTLTIPEVRLNSTGEYSCTASNSVGTSTASALVTGEARPAVILSGPESEQEDSYQLVWSVASRAPVNSSVVSVRRQGEELWTKHDVIVSDDNEAVNATEDDEDYTGALTLTDLKPGTTYEVSVATRNSFGLVDHGNIFTFTTKKETEELLKETDEEEEGREKESHQGDVDSQRAVTTGVATEVRPLITPVILACLASFTTL